MFECGTALYDNVVYLHGWFCLDLISAAKSANQLCKDISAWSKLWIPVWSGFPNWSQLVKTKIKIRSGILNLSYHLKIHNAVRSYKATKVIHMIEDSDSFLFCLMHVNFTKHFYRSQLPFTLCVGFHYRFQQNKESGQSICTLAWKILIEMHLLANGKRHIGSFWNRMSLKTHALTATAI